MSYCARSPLASSPPLQLIITHVLSALSEDARAELPDGDKEGVSAPFGVADGFRFYVWECPLLRCF